MEPVARPIIESIPDELRQIPQWGLLAIRGAQGQSHQGPILRPERRTGEFDRPPNLVFLYGCAECPPAQRNLRRHRVRTE